MELVTLSPRKDRAPWLLLPCVLLALSTVTLLAPHRAAQAAPLSPSTPKQAASAYDDGDGDELLEHWGDPKYVREQRLQEAGMAGGFVLLASLGYYKRGRRASKGLTQTLIEVNEQRKAA